MILSSNDNLATRVFLSSYCVRSNFYTYLASTIWSYYHIKSVQKNNILASDEYKQKARKQKVDERAIKRQRKGIRLVYTSKGRERENVMNNTSHAFLF